jgi:hypothetical protein
MQIVVFCYLSIGLDTRFEFSLCSFFFLLFLKTVFSFSLHLNFSWLYFFFFDFVFCNAFLVFKCEKKGSLYGVMIF